MNLQEGGVCLGADGSFSATGGDEAKLAGGPGNGFALFADAQRAFDHANNLHLAAGQGQGFAAGQAAQAHLEKLVLDERADGSGMAG